MRDPQNSLFLRHGLGDGEGRLDQHELAEALRHGLVSVNEKDQIALTEKGLQQSKAWKVIRQYEGKGVNRPPYNRDGKLGKLELAQAGVRDRHNSLFLRHGLGDGEGFLDRQELAQALNKGLISISEEGQIALTEKGLRKSKAWNAEHAG